VAMEKLLGWPGDRGFVTLIIAHTTFTLAYVSVIVQSRLADMDPSIDEAAQDLGARPLKIFFWITLPMILPALASGWLLAFSLSVDDVVISQFVTGPGYTTLPLRVFASVKLGIDPKINALGTLIILLVGTGALLSGISMMRRSKKTK
ncbi:MAG: ABC transporter permease subunit, partial [Alphaproteobacteria bacterium]|nr:ABC transporter permease subunit [Alphaproteobacteria bacterium]